MNSKIGRPRVLVAGLFHETHSFVEEKTSLAAFEIKRGADILAIAGDGSPLGGALAFGMEAGWEWAPAADYRAMPSGTVEDAVIEHFWNDLRAACRPDLDAVFLVLHGAMASESFPDVEGEILRRLRQQPGCGRLPVFGVYDLHGNFSPAMALHADALLAYRENPHADARESALRAAALLQRCLATKERPRMTLRRTPFIWIPSRTGTGSDPMASLERLAREIERREPSIWAVNVAAGFAYADTPDTGLSFQTIGVASSEIEGGALGELEELAAQLDQTAPAIPEISVEQALDELIRHPVGGLTVLVEPSDNIGAGAPGDGTVLLRALMDPRLGAGLARGDLGICLNDPGAVAALAGLEAGGRMTLSIGGKGSRLDPGPVRLEVELASRSDGRFAIEDPRSHLASMTGGVFDMGPSAVVRRGRMVILLTSKKTPPFDLGQWRSQGIDPSGLSAIVVKAAVAHRRAYDPIAARSFWVDTPGPCASRVERLPFIHRRSELGLKS